MVFQNYALYPHMTVEQNLGFGLRLRKTPKDQQRSRVAEAARIRARSAMARKPAELSGRANVSRWGGRWSGNRKPHGRALVEPGREAPRQMRAELSGCTNASARPRCTSPTIRWKR